MGKKSFNNQLRDNAKRENLKTLIPLSKLKPFETTNQGNSILSKEPMI